MGADLAPGDVATTKTDRHESLPHTCFIPEGSSRQETSIVSTLSGGGECYAEAREEGGSVWGAATVHLVVETFA